MVLFNLRLEQTYWSKGFFNVPVDFERFLSPEDGPVDIFLGSASVATAGRMTRRANRNATPRVFGNKPLQQFFQLHFKVGECVSVEFLSQHSVRIGGHVSPEGVYETQGAGATRPVVNQVILGEPIQAQPQPASGADLYGYLVVVSCGNDKVWDRKPDPGPTAARDAYTSSIFKKSRRYAEHFAPNAWMILSAKYGFVEPDFIIPENYNRMFSDSDAISVSVLRQQVVAKNLAKFTTVGVLGSELYRRQVEQAFEGTHVVCRHINGNVSFAPLFQSLIDDLLAKDTPFREEDER
jgi:hypothetical protein